MPRFPLETPTLALFVSLMLTSLPAAGEWPHLRGPNLDGRTGSAGPAGKETGAPALELDWRIALGSGYSGVAVADGRVVAMYADDQGDWVGAFAAATGKPLWKHRLGATTRGEDGSDDGPLSSPVIGDGRVYALAPAGRLVALRLSDGEPVWETSLPDAFGSERPHFGFTTTPLYVEGQVIVQAGGTEGRSLIGLGAASGELGWKAGDGSTDYQSPSLMTLAGRKQIVALVPGKILGLSPKGDPLWERTLADGDRVSNANPTFVGDDRFLVLLGGGAAVFRVERGDDGLSAREMYRSEALGRTYAPPVYHDGHAYGFRGQVLTCMRVADGERVWRSRPPGGDGLILVDRRLVIFGARGNVVVADASPEGYRELARLQALEGSALTWPSFSGGRVFVRNLDELAAVALRTDAGAGQARRTGEVPRPDHEFGRWVRRVEAADADRTAMVQAFLEQHPRLPLVEGDYAHFVYLADARDVSIVGSMTDGESPEPMERVAGTNLFYRSFRLVPGSRWEYRYQVDLDDAWVLDPHNPRTVPAVDGEAAFSELLTAGYTEAGHLAPPDGPRGRIESFALDSEILGYEKQVRVWLPPGYDDSGQAYPLLVVNDGHAWLDRGLMANSLDNLVGRSVAPVVVACLDAHPRWWLEAGGSRTAEYVSMQVEELVPALAARYRLVDAPGSRAVMGHRYYGLSTMYAAVVHPDVFGKAAVQSAYLGLGAGSEVFSRVSRRAGADSLRIYLDWNRFDERNVDRGYDFAEDSRTLDSRLREAGYDVTGGEILDSHGWGGWRNRTDRMLQALFPAL